jgi:hypothetical protein
LILKAALLVIAGFSFNNISTRYIFVISGGAMDYRTDLPGDVGEEFELFYPMPSALSDPKIPRELRRASLTFFVIDKPGDDPEFVSARDLDVKPLNDPALMSLTDTNNILSTKTNSGAPSIDKPPSSPRPGFRSLPTATTQEQENPFLRDASSDIAKTPFGQQNSHSTQRAATATADLQTPNSPRGLLPASTTRSATSSSAPADQYDSNNHMKDLSGAESSQPSPFISTSQPAKQQSSPKIASVPQIGAAKSAIPPTFTPNASPSFTSLANTKPKHKSPLGSQPPIFAADSSAKPSSLQQAAAGLNKAARNLATIGFLEPHGILQQYIEHTVTVLIEDALRQFEREEPLRAARESPSPPQLFSLYCHLS